jgi:hypothetical protein
MSACIQRGAVTKRFDRPLAEWKSKEDVMARIFIDFLRRTRPG